MSDRLTYSVFRSHATAGMGADEDEPEPLAWPLVKGPVGPNVSLASQSSFGSSFGRLFGSGFKANNTM